MRLRKLIAGWFVLIFLCLVLLVFVWALPGLTGLYRALLGSAGTYVALPGHNRPYRALPGHPDPS